MPSASLPDMVQPAAGSTFAFVAIVLALCVLLVLGVQRAGRIAGEARSRTRSWTVAAALAVSAWLALTGAVSASGVLEMPARPPPLMIFFFASQLAAIVAAFSPLGTRLLQLPVAALVGFQVFRLPLELVLHAWVEGGTLPVQMTYEGENFDIVSGLLALPVAWLAARRPNARWPVLAFNVVGLALLINVARIAAFSSPVPFRTYLQDPPVLLAFHFPYGWIVPICVGGALFGHVLVFRSTKRGRDLTFNFSPGGGLRAPASRRGPAWRRALRSS